MAGAGYKLFATGDVLTAAQVNTYLQEQAVMVFANAAARTTALSGVLAEGMVTYLKDTDAVEIYNGSAWVGIAADQTPLTTKGDLFTYSTTDARLAVGNNGETLVADSSTSTGLRYTAGNPIPNPVLNSAFQVWQRGTSIALSASTAYTADRWQGRTGTGAQTISRQTTGDTTNLPFIQYCARVGRNSGNTGTGIILFEQSMETVNSIPFIGRTITLSFYARRGANFSGTSNILYGSIITGTGTDQNIVSYTGGAIAGTASATLTTTWQRFSVTATTASTANEIALQFEYTPTGTAGAADYYEITGIQLDVGSVALPFRTNGATLAGELAACQRYFERYEAASTAVFYTGYQQTSTSPRISSSIYAKRSTPTITTGGAGTLQVLVAGGSGYNVTSIDAISYSANGNTIGFRANIASGGTAGDACALYANGGAVTLDYSSEL